MDGKTIKNEVNKKEDLPISIIIWDVPKALFEDEELKFNFSNMFTQIDENVWIDYLKSFQRVRLIFTKPEHATTAKLLVEHHAFNGAKMKVHFTQNIKLIRRAYQDNEGYLKLPPLEKQFLISPPSSPPVGWTQCEEMAPIVCDFDLMSRLATFTVDDDYELHVGEDGQPAIVVTPCGRNRKSPTTAREGSPNATDDVTLPESISIIADNHNDDELVNLNSGTASIAKIARPRTPRPPM